MRRSMAQTLFFSLVLNATSLAAAEDKKPEPTPPPPSPASETPKSDEWDTPKRDQVETLFGKRESAGGYGLFSVERGKFLNDENLTFFGMRLGWMLTRSFGIGLATSGLATERKLASGDNAGVTLYGLSLETTLFPHSPAHLNLVVTAGEGHFTAEDTHNGTVKRRDIFSYVEPELNLELNIQTWFRVLLGYRHRMISSIDMAGYRDEDLSGGLVLVGLKFGMF